MSSAETPTGDAPLSELTGFQRDLLVIVAGHGPANGLELKKQLDSALGDETNHGRFYPNLNKLVGMHLVHKSEADGRTNTYKITKRGVSELTDNVNWQLDHMEAADE